MNSSTFDDGIDFGPLPEGVNSLLQRGVVAYRTSEEDAEIWFRLALTAAPSALPVYFCLYKVYTYRNQLEKAEQAAKAGLAIALAELGWSAATDSWPLERHPEGAARFALFTLKALAFIALKAGRLEEAQGRLLELARLDPEGQVGWPVVQALLEGILRETDSTPASTKVPSRGRPNPVKRALDLGSPLQSGAR